jgi:AcrR family transcriptional regulator
MEESTIQIKKNAKENRLLEAAYKEFTTKGVNNTSIQDIVASAGVAKGTFYLYFKDKYDLQNKLITKKSRELFNDALKELANNYITSFADQLIFVINHVIDYLKNEPILINFISKDLSLGFYSDKLSNLLENKALGVNDVFMEAIKKNKVKLKNPEVTLFMIIELVSSTCFTSISKNYPLPIEEYKPYLYDTIRMMLKAE